MASSETLPNTSEVVVSKTTLNSNTDNPSRNSAVVTAAAHWKNNRLQSISLPPNTNLLRNDVVKEESTSEPSDQQSRRNSRASLIPGTFPSLNNDDSAENRQKLSATSEVIKYQLQAGAVIGQGVTSQVGEHVDNVDTRVGDSLIFTIPYMDIRLAYVCLFLNIVIPGLGTMLSGFSLLCFSSSTPQDDRKQDELIQLCYSNLCVGLSQMFTITFFLVGWIWSITWGVNMVIFARTLVAGVSIFVSSNPQGLTKRDPDVLQDSFISNVCVGLSQMFTITFLLVGWIWSIVWGINMILISKHHTHLVNREMHRLKALSLANKLFK